LKELAELIVPATIIVKEPASDPVIECHEIIFVNESVVIKEVD